MPLSSDCNFKLGFRSVQYGISLDRTGTVPNQSVLVPVLTESIGTGIYWYRTESIGTGTSTGNTEN